MPVLSRRRTGNRVVEDAGRVWIGRFADPQSPVIAHELVARLVDALRGDAVAPMVEEARRLGVLRARQGHTVAAVVEDVVALRAALHTAGETDQDRLAALTDLVVVGATTAYVDELRQVLESKATRDALTGLANRAAFHEALNHEIAAASRTAAPTVLLVDLDHFGEVNDTHGYLRGDELLVAASRLITRRLREMDVVARWGADEFAAVLPRTGQRPALAAARRLVRAARSDPSLHVGGIRVSLSIGVGWLPQPHTVDELVAVADAALSRVRADGGDDAVLGALVPQPR